MALQSSSFTNIEANGTTTVRTGRGVLRRIVINTKGASANVLTLYDGVSASGTLIATFDTTVSFGSFEYDCEVIVGLTVVMATGTAAKVTVIYD